VVTRFDPRVAIGETIDVAEHGGTDESLAPPQVAAILSAGFQPLSYRLATELGGEAWHWNPKGTWSDPARHEGYWTSASQLGKPIDVSYGYRLPRRGNTHDQSRDDSYSRIDDGDVNTFWKSNPYSTTPQWFLADLGSVRSLDEIDIQWGKPYAAEYTIEIWTGDDALNNPRGGTWKSIIAVQARKGGRIATALPHASARYVRVLMTRSCCTSAGDWRDSIGYAVREVQIRGSGVDLVRHGRSNTTQTVVWVSSTDPWHRASDIDREMEQPGFDRVVASGITRELPILTPVALLYGTPDDAAAEVRYLRARNFTPSFLPDLRTRFTASIPR